MGNTREAPSDGGLGEFLQRWRGGWRAISAPRPERFVTPAWHGKIVVFQPRESRKMIKESLFLATKRGMPSLEEIGTAELILMGKQARSDRNRTMRIPQLGEQTLCGQTGFHVLAQ